ncbi:ABC transporter ATP-binding protein [Chelativorans composti]|uniref:ABC transporter ATP-binding protein n=1 Tax=Chelativorans composti TaxID=768533 RepID=A0ABW5DGT6_9HYPH
MQIDRLTLEPGMRIALAGPSGSGKSTFIHMITGMDRPSTGSVKWGDTELSKLSERRRDQWRARNVGLVMQDFHLFPGMSAEANVLLPQRLARFGLREAPRRRALELLRRTGIERPEQPVETLSRGQMQRVAVARALVGNPKIIIADEPTASLDAGSGEAVAELLTELTADSGATILAATHDERLIRRMDKVLRLENGELVS